MHHLDWASHRKWPERPWRPIGGGVSWADTHWRLSGLWAFPDRVSSFPRLFLCRCAMGLRRSRCWESGGLVAKPEAIRSCHIRGNAVCVKLVDRCDSINPGHHFLLQTGQTIGDRKKVDSCVVCRIGGNGVNAHLLGTTLRYSGREPFGGGDLDPLLIEHLFGTIMWCFRTPRQLLQFLVPLAIGVAGSCGATAIVANCRRRRDVILV